MAKIFCNDDHIDIFYGKIDTYDVLHPIASQTSKNLKAFSN